MEIFCISEIKYIAEINDKSAKNQSIMLGISLSELADPPMYRNEGTSIKHKKITEVAKTSRREKIAAYNTQTAMLAVYNLSKLSNLETTFLRIPVEKKLFKDPDLNIRIPWFREVYNSEKGYQRRICYFLLAIIQNYHCFAMVSNNIHRAGKLKIKTFHGWMNFLNFFRVKRNRFSH